MSKRTISAVAVLGALALPAAATALPARTVHRYQREYHAVVAKFGARAPGRNIVRDGLSTGGRAAVGDVERSIGVLSRMLHPPVVVHRPVVVAHPATTTPRAKGVAPTPAPAPAATSAPATPAPAPTGATGGGLADVPGVPASFAACVAQRESGNGAYPNVYGIIPASGHNVAGMSVAQQKQVFAQIYRTVGARAWSPYDGC